jgi:hypothetical protein
MSIIEFKYYELDKAIDERIQQSNDIRNEWGRHIFDDEGRLQNSEDFPLDQYTLLGIVQYQQEQITKLQKRLLRGSKSVGRLKMSDRVTHKCVSALLDRVTVLENEMIDKDLRISKLEKEVEKL